MTAQSFILAGMVFGRLSVVVEVSPARWLCLCECSNQHTASGALLRNGSTKSCGCLRKETTAKLRTTHGMSSGRAYQSWSHMIQRCQNPQSAKWAHYGGRGITVCDRWQQASNFLQDMGEAPAGMSLDRIDVDGNYEPGNCRWATQKQQTRNMRKTRWVVWGGKETSLADLSEATGVAYSMLRDRINRGWSVERAVLEPRK